MLVVLWYRPAAVSKGHSGTAVAKIMNLCRIRKRGMSSGMVPSCLVILNGLTEGMAG